MKRSRSRCSPRSAHTLIPCSAVVCCCWPPDPPLVTAKGTTHLHHCATATAAASTTAHPRSLLSPCPSHVRFDARAHGSRPRPNRPRIDALPHEDDDQRSGRCIGSTVGPTRRSGTRAARRSRSTRGRVCCAGSGAPRCATRSGARATPRSSRGSCSQPSPSVSREREDGVSNLPHAILVQRLQQRIPINFDRSRSERMVSDPPRALAWDDDTHGEVRGTDPCRAANNGPLPRGEQRTTAARRKPDPCRAAKNGPLSRGGGEASSSRGRSRCPSHSSSPTRRRPTAAAAAAARGAPTRSTPRCMKWVVPPRECSITWRITLTVSFTYALNTSGGTRPLSEPLRGQ